MFERYTERARRVLFFARYEASQFGSLSIETEHLLLGLVREGKGLTSRTFARGGLSPDAVRTEIASRVTAREPISASVEIPFSQESKRVLQFAAEEADRLSHAHIGTEHLLLGILREERSVAATILASKGLSLDAARRDIVELLREVSPRIDRADVKSQIDAVKALVARVTSGPHTAAGLNELVEEIQQSLDDLNRFLSGAP
jgi:ATP-dependent Clp protease ATP-binding subunit ClpC